jgi:hypothetical protein
MPESRPIRRPRLDLVGAILGALGMGLVRVHGPNHGHRPTLGE